MDKTVFKQKCWVIVIILAIPLHLTMAALEFSQTALNIWKFFYCLLLPVLVVPFPILRNLGFSNEKILRQVLLGIICGAVTVIAVFTCQAVCARLLLPEYQLTFYQPIASMSAGSVVSVLVMQFFHSSVEEVLFRGYLQKQMVVFFRSEKVRILLISVIFGGIHIVPYLFPDNLSGIVRGLQDGSYPVNLLFLLFLSRFVLTALFSLIVGILVWKKKGFTTLSAACAHITYNYILSLLIGFNIS